MNKLLLLVLMLFSCGLYGMNQEVVVSDKPSYDNLPAEILTRIVGYAVSSDPLKKPYEQLKELNDQYDAYGTVSRAFRQATHTAIEPLARALITEGINKQASKLHADPQFNSSKDTINIRNANGDTTLMSLAKICDTKEKAELLRSVLRYLDPNLEERDNKGRTSLALAAIWGNPYTISLLARHGGHVNTRDNFKWTPLMHTVYYTRDDISATEELLKYNPDIAYLRTDKGLCPLKMALNLKNNGKPWNQHLPTLVRELRKRNAINPLKRKRGSENYLG